MSKVASWLLGDGRPCHNTSADSLQPLRMIIICAESANYHRIEAVKADTVIMPCSSTLSSNVLWIQNMTNGYFNHVYKNGTIRGRQNIPSQFSVVNASAGDYSLKIYNVHPTYSGLYDCYDGNGTRIIGYYLIAKGICLTFLLCFRNSSLITA